MTNQEPGTHAVGGRLLTINTGSSSLKAALYAKRKAALDEMSALHQEFGLE